MKNISSPACWVNTTAHQSCGTTSPCTNQENSGLTHRPSLLLRVGPLCVPLTAQDTRSETNSYCCRPAASENFSWKRLTAEFRDGVCIAGNSEVMTLDMGIDTTREMNFGIQQLESRRCKLTETQRVRRLTPWSRKLRIKGDLSH
jgi:hypothetical protein